MAGGFRVQCGVPAAPGRKYSLCDVSLTNTMSKHRRNLIIINISIISFIIIKSPSTVALYLILSPSPALPGRSAPHLPFPSVHFSSDFLISSITMNHCRSNWKHAHRTFFITSCLYQARYCAHDPHSLLNWRLSVPTWRPCVGQTQTPAHS